MATEVIMPALGMAQDTGILVAWLRGEGDEVTKGEPLMEVETDKAVVEVEAPASGRLAAVTAAAGDQVPVGHVIAQILAVGEEAAPVAASAATSNVPADEAAPRAPAGAAVPQAPPAPGPGAGAPDD
ncbi:MAG: biotin/lipoyl-containing protein, partial [Candidatus Dormibacteraceae bacterium]